MGEGSVKTEACEVLTLPENLSKFVFQEIGTMDYSVVEKAFKENIEAQKECQKYPDRIDTVISYIIAKDIDATIGFEASYYLHLRETHKKNLGVRFYVLPYDQLDFDNTIEKLPILKQFHLEEDGSYCFDCGLKVKTLSKLIEDVLFYMYDIGREKTFKFKQELTVFKE